MEVEAGQNTCLVWGLIWKCGLTHTQLLWTIALERGPFTPHGQVLKWPGPEFESQLHLWLPLKTSFLSTLLDSLRLVHLILNMKVLIPISQIVRIKKKCLARQNRDRETHVEVSRIYAKFNASLSPLQLRARFQVVLTWEPAVVISDKDYLVYMYSHWSCFCAFSKEHSLWLDLDVGPGPPLVVEVWASYRNSLGLGFLICLRII